MAKKKDKPQVINNIEEINLEIDYDKLAEAIVKVQKASNAIDDQEFSDEVNNSPKSKWKTFWYNVFHVVINDNKGKSNFLPSSLIAIIQTLFNAISFLLFCISPSILFFGGRRVYDWIVGAQTDIIGTIIFIIVCVVLFVMFALVALVFRGIANDIGREKDKHYIISVFSGLTGFAALIIAIIALFKGVG